MNDVQPQHADIGSDSLARALSEQVPMTLISTTTGVALRARLLDRYGRLLQVTVPPTEEHVNEFRDLSGCVAVFMQEQRAHLLLASVARQARWSKAANQFIIELELRSGVLRGEARSAFRVPVTADAGLLAGVRDGTGKAWTLQASDVSVSGVGGTLPSASDGALPIGEEVDVALRLGEVTVRLRGQIRSRELGRPGEPSRCGIHFPSVWIKGELHPPKDLRDLVGEVEREWLRRQREVA